MLQGQEIWHRRTGVKIRCQRYGAVRIVRRNFHVVDLGHGGNSEELSDSATMRYVHLQNVHRSHLKPFANSPASELSFASRNADSGPSVAPFYPLPPALGKRGGKGFLQGVAARPLPLATRLASRAGVAA